MEQDINTQIQQVDEYQLTTAEIEWLWEHEWLKRLEAEQVAIEEFYNR